MDQPVRVLGDHAVDVVLRGEDRRGIPVTLAVTCLFHRELKDLVELIVVPGILDLRQQLLPVKLLLVEDLEHERLVRFVAVFKQFLPVEPVLHRAEPRDLLTTSSEPPLDVIRSASGVWTVGLLVP
jgi:hypothetical protein